MKRSVLIQYGLTFPLVISQIVESFMYFTQCIRKIKYFIMFSVLNKISTPGLYIEQGVGSLGDTCRTELARTVSGGKQCHKEAFYLKPCC